MLVLASAIVKHWSSIAYNEDVIQPAVATDSLPIMTQDAKTITFALAESKRNFRAVQDMFSMKTMVFVWLKSGTSARCIAVPSVLDFDIMRLLIFIDVLLIH